MNYGTWSEITLATSTENQEISSTPITYTDQDGDFEITLEAGGSGTTLDGTNYKKLLNNGDGSYRVNINEDGSSMNGRYIVHLIGRSGTPADGIDQSIAYTSIGNDVTSIITAYDTDNTQAGATLADITVEWEIHDVTDVTKQDIYVLPTGTSLNVATQSPVATFNDNTTKAWSGNTTEDSVGSTVVAGDYTVYVVTDSGSVANLYVELAVNAD